MGQRKREQAEINGGVILYIGISLFTAAAVAAAGIMIVKKRFKNEVKYSPKTGHIFLIVSLIVFAAFGTALPLLANAEDWTLFSVLRTLSVLCWTYFAGVIDLKLKIIPNELVIGMLIELTVISAAEAICDFSGFKSVIISSILGGLAMGVIFLLGRALSKGGMGMGDVKLVLMCGLFLGFENVIGMVFWALVFSVITGIVLMSAKKAKLKTKLPMGPFFFAGALVSNTIYIISGLNGG